MAKGFKDYMREANAVITTHDVEKVMGLVGDDSFVIVDIRDGDEVETGRIPGAVHASRGLLEFKIDPTSPMHEPALSSGKHIVFYCGTGGRSALATKLAVDMGLDNVAHMAGGIKAWKEAGNKVE